jgi:hypothetical protein
MQIKSGKRYILAGMLALAKPVLVKANAAGTPNDPLIKVAASYKMPVLYLQQAMHLYDTIGLASVGLERDVFYQAYKGYLMLLGRGLVTNTKMLSIADFSQSSRNKRLYVIDLEREKLVFHTFVSHGKNSGGEVATSFSNLTDSYKSTLGFLITADTYSGAAGYSLRFNGLEPGINDRVRSRDIVVHGSRYVNERQALEDGKVANSLGCPAVPMSNSRAIIDCIKGGSVYYIYHPDDYYHATSPILNADLWQGAPFSPAVLTTGADAADPVVPQPGENDQH